MSGAESILVAATFTAKPLQKYLLTGGASRVDFAPYNQLIQWLHDPTPQDPSRIPVFLLRASDFVRADHPAGADREAACRSYVETLIEALQGFCDANPVVPRILLIPSAEEDFAGGDSACGEVQERLRQLECVRHLAWSDFLAEVKGIRLFDPVADRIGHVPFTVDGFRRLSEFILQGIRRHKDPVDKPLRQTQNPVAGKSSGLDRFLAKLKLRVNCRAIDELEQLKVAAKLSHTVASFHATGNRFSEEELRRLLADGKHVGLSVEVADRFGDYGMSGYLIVSHNDGMVIDELVLSCVVLGKQVEHCLLHRLAECAGRLGDATVSIAYRQDERNDDILRFLEDLRDKAGVSRQVAGDGTCGFKLSPRALSETVLAAAPSADAVLDAQVGLDVELLESVSDADVT